MIAITIGAGRGPAGIMATIRTLGPRRKRHWCLARKKVHIRELGARYKSA